MVRLNKALALGFTQSQVDFVVPDLSLDLPLAIDPFLLYKSRDERLRRLHDHLVGIFNRGIRCFREGQREDLDRLIDFPEVNEIGFGYSAEQIKGRGLGWHLNRLLADTLAASVPLQERGLRHIEEMQLVSLGVGPDRVSDIAANVLKSFLIEYTQTQAALWSIPITKDIPVEHYFDFDESDWTDGYFDLPLNPISQRPILLVPRRMVRQLPWINYDDYFRSDFKQYLKARQPRSRSDLGKTRTPLKPPAKGAVVGVTRTQMELIDQYVGRKEREGDRATPDLPIDAEEVKTAAELGEGLISRLQTLPTGQQSAASYQRLVFEIINYLFEPELTDGKLEVETHLGTERRDIIYTNESERSHLKFVREKFQSQYIVFEVKNVREVELDHVNQMATYLGARLGMFGYIVARNSPGKNIVTKTYSVYNDTPSMPRKTILVVADANLILMIRRKIARNNPVDVLKGLYEKFMYGVQ